MKNQIHFKKDKFQKYNYYIYIAAQPIGEISFIKRNNIILIGYLHIYEDHRNRHYGYQVVEYLLSHYKINCIIGETLYESRGFWNKCIHKYNGQRKNITYCDDCSSSFVIPKCNISRLEIYDLLNDFYKIL